MMDIEIVEAETNPLKDLFDYLNKEIYPKMSAKDVKEIKSKGMNGELFKHIESYKNECIFKALEEKENQHKVNISSLQGIIKELKENGGKKNERYSKRVDNYVGD